MINKDFFEGLGLLIFVGVMLFILYLNLVAEPKCQMKGFAGIDSQGCWIIKDGVRIHE